MKVGAAVLAVVSLFLLAAILPSPALAATTTNISVLEKLRIAAATGELDLVITNISLSGSKLTYSIRNNEPFPITGVSLAADIVKDNAISESFPKPSDVIVASSKTAKADIGPMQTIQLFDTISVPKALGAGNYRLDLYLLVQDSSLEGRYERRVPNFFKRVSSNRAGAGRLELSMLQSSICANLAWGSHNLFENADSKCRNMTGAFLAELGEMLTLQVQGRSNGEAGRVVVSAELFKGQAKISGGAYTTLADKEQFNLTIPLSLPLEPEEYALVLSATNGEGLQSQVRLPVVVEGAPPRILAVLASADNFTAQEESAVAVIFSHSKAKGRFLALASVQSGNYSVSLDPVELRMGDSFGSYSAFWPFSVDRNMTEFSVDMMLTDAYGRALQSASVEKKAQSSPLVPPQPLDFALPVVAVAVAVALLALPYVAKARKKAQEKPASTPKGTLAPMRSKAAIEAQLSASKGADKAGAAADAIEIPKKENKDAKKQQ